MFHMARETVNKFMKVTITYNKVPYSFMVYVPLVDGKPYLSPAMYEKVCRRLRVPNNLPYVLTEREYVRTGHR